MKDEISKNSLNINAIKHGKVGIMLTLNWVPI
jgi:hypothetical protein